MRRKTYRIMAIMATALLAFATGGCVDPLDDSLKPQPEEPTLTFWIHVPGSMLTTKALTGDVDGIQYESTLHDVQVWVFPHNNNVATTRPLSYIEKDLDDTDPDEWDTHTTTNDDWLPEPEGSSNTPHLNSRWAKAYKIQMPMPKEYVIDNTDPRVDFYILANWKTIFSNDEKPDMSYTLAEVRDLVFGETTIDNPYFGTDRGTTGSDDYVSPTTTVKKDTGLPISTVYMGANNAGVSLKFLQNAYNGIGEPLTNDLFKRELGVIELERAVAKIRFAFARSAGMADVEITSIVIDGDLIPDKTFAFPRSSFELPDGNNATFGGATTLSGFTGEDIPEIGNPESLRSDSHTVFNKTGESYNGYAPGGTPTQTEGVYENPMTAQMYSDLLDDNTESRLVYFRETKKEITGTINCKIGGVSKAVPFKMSDSYGYTSSNTNLHRNHYWIVYAYFRGGSLWIKPVLVQEWDDVAPANYSVDGTALIAISDETQSLFGYGWTTSNQNTWYKPNAVPAQKTEWYFRRQDWNSEEHEHDFLQPTGAEPYDGDDWVHSQVVVAPGRDPFSGAPLYANKIELRSNYLVDLKLKCDNPAFGFVVYDSNSQFSDILDEVVITRNASASDSDKSTFFYLVPKYDTTPQERIAKVSLVTTGDQPVKLPFNAGVFPGSEENSEIYFYYVTETEFKSFYAKPTDTPPHPPVNIRAFSESGVDYTNQLWPSE